MAKLNISLCHGRRDSKTVTERRRLHAVFVRMSPAVLRASAAAEGAQRNPWKLHELQELRLRNARPWIPFVTRCLRRTLNVTARLCKNGVEVGSRVTTTFPDRVEMEALVPCRPRR